MTETQKTKVNLQILQATNELLERLARLTFRKKGDVIDWLVNEKFNELTVQPASPISSPCDTQE